MKAIGLLVSANLALCLATTIVTGDAACTPTETQTIAADLPSIVAGTDAACVVLEGSLATTAAGPVVDMICSGTEGLESVVEGVLKASPEATAVKVTAPVDAGMQSAVVLRTVRVEVARAVLGSCIVPHDAGGG